MQMAMHVTLWKRHKLARLVLEHLGRVKAQLARDNIDCIIIAVVSPDEDPESVPIAALADHVVEAPNHPLGEKANAGSRLALALDVDGLMTVGSDDFVGVEWVRWAAKALMMGAVAATLPGCCYLLPRSLPLYIAGSAHAGSDDWAKDNGAPAQVGAGRAYGREMLDATAGDLWPASNNSGLDTGAFCKNARIWRAATVAVWPGPHAPLLDVKTEGGITQPSKLALERAVPLPSWWCEVTFGSQVAIAVEEFSGVRLCD